MSEIRGTVYDAEIEYLESTGTQEIDTGIKGTNNTSLYIKGSFTSTISGDTLGIAADFWSNDSARCGVVYNKGQNNLYTNVQSGYMVRSINLSTNTPHEIELRCTGTNATSYINGSQMSTKTISSFTTLDTIKTNINVANTKIYAIKIWENNVLVRDFIPVRVGNVGYLYDKVSGQLFGNSGTGSFVLGADKEYLPLTGGMLTGQVSAPGFIKSGSSDSYALLGGGGHKLLSEISPFPPLTGNTERFRFKATNFAWFSTRSVKVPFLVRGGVQEEIFFPVFSTFGIIYIHAGNYTVGMQGWGWWCLGDGNGVSVSYNTDDGYLHISISKSGSGWNVYYYVPFVVYANGLNYQGTATLEDQYTNSGMFALD